MWVAVSERFRRFVADLQITTAQIEDGWTKFNNVSSSLERAYFETEGDSHHGLLVGSWGKGTQVRPPSDVDAFFILPGDVKQRFDARSGNVQSALLQEVKAVLASKYPQTDIRGDGQVVSIAFNTITVEVVPVFLTALTQFWMPDTNEGGRWKLVDPIAQIERIRQTNDATNGNVRALSKMIKHWRNEKSVPLKSFIIELLVAEFLTGYSHNAYNTYWYDWYVRDFLKFLVSKANGTVTIPGTYESYYLGDAWLSKATTARDTAVLACEWEYSDYDVTAGQEWQKIFGPRIPIHVR